MTRKIGTFATLGRMSFATLVNLTFATGASAAEDGAVFASLEARALLGDKARSSLNLDKCRQLTGLTIQAPRGFWHEIVPSPVKSSTQDKAIVFTGTILIIGEDYTPITEFTRYVVQPDDTVFVTMRALPPKTYDIGTDIKTFSCKLGEGVTLTFGR
ncbi:hypothetical protein FHS76_000717 [Ochrobactrum daejeonense]|uniref:VirK protein n=1 Tax=Brucella daejeonensis TaxID=659015 RepID=A0A7W9EK31_9HYPH|nr:VirK family protein [Brucella daejeonensis]MBB5700874.1 hypothetical protein [Brucella daejeonensis]